MDMNKIGGKIASGHPRVIHWPDASLVGVLTVWKMGDGELRWELDRSPELAAEVEENRRQQVLRLTEKMPRD